MLFKFNLVNKKTHENFMSSYFLCKQCFPIMTLKSLRACGSELKLIITKGNFYFRRWAGKTSYVHLAPEHGFTVKHLRGTE